MRKIELNIFNDDFREFIQALGRYNVDYLLIGGYSVILYGYHRTTGDMDILVRKTELIKTKTAVGRYKYHENLTT